MGPFDPLSPLEEEVAIRKKTMAVEPGVESWPEKSRAGALGMAVSMSVTCRRWR